MLCVVFKGHQRPWDKTSVKTNQGRTHPGTNKWWYKCCACEAQVLATKKANFWMKAVPEWADDAGMSGKSLLSNLLAADGNGCTQAISTQVRTKRRVDCASAVV